MGKLHAYYLFGDSPLPDDLCTEVNRELVRLQEETTPEAYLKAAYQLITIRYEAGRLNTILKFFDLFSTSLQDLWNRSGFMHCTNQNYLLALLLVKGGHFKESDVRRAWTLIGFFSPHQYLKVRLGADQWVAVDCWARHYGIGYGNYARGFNSTLLKSFVS